MDELLNPYQRLSLKAVLDLFEQSVQYSSAWVASWRASVASDPRRSLAAEDCDAATDLIMAAGREMASLRQEMQRDTKAANPCSRIHADVMVARASYGTAGRKNPSVLDIQCPRLTEFWILRWRVFQNLRASWSAYLRRFVDVE